MDEKWRHWAYYDPDRPPQEYVEAERWDQVRETGGEAEYQRQAEAESQRRAAERVEAEQERRAEAARAAERAQRWERERLDRGRDSGPSR